MRAIRFHHRPLRYLLARAASARLPTIGAGSLGFVSLDDVEPPDLPGPGWVRVESRLSGICGTDLGVITAQDSFTLEPFGAFPFTFGHEIVGTVVETAPEVSRWRAGDRVIVNPMLACEQRGLEPCGACARGEYGLCRRQTEGLGAQIGFSPLTGGGWSRFFVAHQTQLHPQGRLPDEVALLTDPLVSAARGVLLEPPAEDDVVLVIGAGTIGLLVVRALRLLGWAGTIAVSARYGFQAERAEAAGASTILRSRDEVHRWAASLPGASSHRPTLAPRFVEGGPSLIYDTVGSESSVNDALALAREAGRIVLIGAAGKLTADWTRLWYRQLRVAGVIAYGPVAFGGASRDVYDVVLELMKADGLADLELVTHVFALEEYRAAITAALDKGRNGAVKVALRPTD